MRPTGPIGVFDSGYGGLTILKALRQALPAHSYLYLGDNARAPYGPRSFEVVHRYTLQAVRHLIEQEGCPLVILACNTASAKALRSIQQGYLATYQPDRRVLGVIRPTVEALGDNPRGHVGLMATAGTVASDSYRLETRKLYPEVTLSQQACPLLVPLIENGEADSPGTDYFVDKYVGELLGRDPQMDTVILGCTHYPLVAGKIRRRLPAGVRLLEQGALVGKSLADYLRRHPEMDQRLIKQGNCRYLTSEDPERFASLASLFMEFPVTASHVELC